jgi:NAD(P)-dependent dehydrogenase (short-subunit alcohol dehydrogenase family)
VVTGATSGSGEAIARLLAAKGMTVVMVGRGGARLSRARQRIGFETSPPKGFSGLVTNHLAPYLLLRSLLEPIGERPARFVVVGAAPGALARVPVDLDDLGCATGRGLGRLPSVRPFAAYGRTKNMNAMLVYGLARRLERTRIMVNGVHPGIVKGTGLGRGSRGV